MPHAALSPSAAHRWMNCYGSVALIGDESSSGGIEAMRGTAAHKVIETMLAAGELDASEYHGRCILVHKPGTEETAIMAPGEAIAEDKLADGWFLFVCDDTMVAGVQMMLDEVERIKDELFDPALYTERYLDGTWLDSRFGGTADVTLVEPGGWIHLFDYKNGRIVVEVTDNEQMKNYCVFLLHEHPDAAGVHVHLVQPNASHEDGCIREEKYTADELKIFELEMKAAAEEVTKPNAPRRAGDWCIFCPAKDRCPEHNDMLRNEALVDFAEDPPEGGIPTPELVEPDDVGTKPETLANGDEYRAALARRARWIPHIDQAARDIRGKIFAELMNGNEVSDGTKEGTWKLVMGRANRKYIDKDQAKAHFIENGIGEQLLMTEPELKSPAQIEKLSKATGIKLKDLKKIVGEVSFKPQGKISIAPGNDPREALDPGVAAGQEFVDDPAEDFTP